jgi:hypothetical protein
LWVEGVGKRGLPVFATLVEIDSNQNRRNRQQAPNTRATLKPANVCSCKNYWVSIVEGSWWVVSHNNLAVVCRYPKPSTRKHAHSSSRAQRASIGFRRGWFENGWKRAQRETLEILVWQPSADNKRRNGLVRSGQRVTAGCCKLLNQSRWITADQFRGQWSGRAAVLSLCVCDVVGSQASHVQRENAVLYVGGEKYTVVVFVECKTAQLRPCMKAGLVKCNAVVLPQKFSCSSQ